MLKTKIISSLSRVFIDSNIDDLTALEKISVLKGERISFQLVHQRVLEDGEGIYDYREVFTPKFSGKLARYITVREVKNVGVELPIIVGDVDEYYERTEPGLYASVSVQFNTVIPSSSASPYVLPPSTEIGFEPTIDMIGWIRSAPRSDM